MKKIIISFSSLAMVTALIFGAAGFSATSVFAQLSYPTPQDTEASVQVAQESDESAPEDAGNEADENFIEENSTTFIVAAFVIVFMLLIALV